MPSQDRIGREQRADFFQSLATKNLALEGQSTPLIVVEQDAFSAVFLLEHVVLGAEIVDHFLLLAVDPTCEDDDVQLPGVEDEIHDRPVGVK